MSKVPHISVLLAETVEALRPRDGATLVDGTFGAGGYSRAFLEAAECTVWAIDRDPRAVAIAHDLEDECQGRFHFVQGRFSEMDDLLAREGIHQVSGVALDIGVSSMQLDEARRGFSFQQDGPLDMRMSGEGETAADVVNNYDQDELADIIYIYGEETKSRRIAKAIVNARAEAPIERTLQLAEIVRRAVGGGKSPTHPATKTFQALRIHVNDELGELERGLAAAERVLEPEGRLAVVTFHSLEDRIVKRFFDERSGRAAKSNPSRHMPVIAQQGPQPSFTQIMRKATKPGADEVAGNPRARSAKLRWAIRTQAPAWVTEEAA